MCVYWCNSSEEDQQWTFLTHSLPRPSWLTDYQESIHSVIRLLSVSSWLISHVIKCCYGGGQRTECKNCQLADQFSSIPSGGRSCDYHYRASLVPKRILPTAIKPLQRIFASKKYNLGVWLSALQFVLVENVIYDTQNIHLINWNNNIIGNRNIELSGIQ